MSFRNFLTQCLTFLVIFSLLLCDTALILLPIYDSNRYAYASIPAIILTIYHVAVILAAIRSPLLGETFKSLRTRKTLSAVALLLCSFFTLVAAGLQIWVHVDPNAEDKFRVYNIVQGLTIGIVMVMQIVAIAYIAWGCSEVEIREGAIRLREDEPVPEFDDNEAQETQLPPTSSDTLALDPERPISMRFLAASAINTLMLCNLAYDYKDTTNIIITIFLLVHHFILIISSFDYVRVDRETGVVTRETFYVHNKISIVLRSSLAKKVFVGLIFVLAILLGGGTGLAFNKYVFLRRQHPEDAYVGGILAQAILQMVETVALLGVGIHSWARMRREMSGGGAMVLPEEEEGLQAS
ncbi:hypothetical protein K435DRAFT_805828 [Dendrothele bispora CBS 962.96]|uniref:Uncharacterized protein n=1 Tax=Dendrothele bispora (strain CBS 962.96) TaxID=1314807 RepID=A0A4S8LAG7_DENBC|nr:hypothetical protein K435DRAFT_805828 [Dendrothele bispora CBS 962.96]